MNEDRFNGIKQAIDNAILFEGLDEQEVADFLKSEVNKMDRAAVASDVYANGGPKAAFCRAYGVDPLRTIGFNVDKTGMVTFTVVGELVKPEPDEK